MSTALAHPTSPPTTFQRVRAFGHLVRSLSRGKKTQRRASAPPAPSTSLKGTPPLRSSLAASASNSPASIVPVPPAAPLGIVREGPQEFELQEMPTPSPPPLAGPREAALIDALARAAGDVNEAVAALDEYAWRSMLAGVRVREYCVAANAAVRTTPPLGLRLALAHSSARLLFPYLVPAGAPSPPQAFIPPHVLAHLSRRQLVDTLVRLAKDGPGPVTEARIHELLLEYIGRRWRAAEGENSAEAVSRKLAEVGAEVLHEPQARETVVPVLQNVCFQLGLVSGSNLAARLNAAPGVWGSLEATQLIHAWTVRKLNASVEPQAVADDLMALRESLTTSTEAVEDVLLSLCLDGRVRQVDDVQQELPSLRPRPRALSKISLRSKRKTMIPQWLSPRPAVVRLQLDEHERRPSLPTNLAEGAGAPQRFGTPTSDNSTSSSSTPSSRHHHSPVAITANSLGLERTDSGRVVLVDHLLALRYRLAADVDGWYLGCGRDKAIDFLDGVDGASAEHFKVVTQLRTAFSLPKPIMVSARTTPTQMSFHERDVSFDLDQYIEDIGPLEGDKSSIVHISPVTSKPPMARHMPQDSTSSAATVVTSPSTSRVSLLSDFSIRRATRREPPRVVMATTYTFPRKLATDDLDINCSSENILVPEVPRYAKSMPNVKDVYTRLPDRPMHRRRSRQQLSDGSTPRIASGPLSSRQFPTARQIPIITPPHSPNSSPGGYTFPRPAPPLSPSSSESHLSPRVLADAGGRSRRQMYRQCVIVDGAHVSPSVSPTLSAPPLPPKPRSTALGSVLALFRCSTLEFDVDEVECKLLDAVESEADRAAARGETFDAEARARIAWLLEQVALELAHPELISAVERVLHRISSPETSPRTPTFASTRPNPSSPRRGAALMIRVPPQTLSSVQICTSPASAGTFGKGSAPPSPTLDKWPPEPLELPHSTEFVARNLPERMNVREGRQRVEPSCTSSHRYEAIHHQPLSCHPTPIPSARLSRRDALRHSTQSAQSGHSVRSPLSTPLCSPRSSSSSATLQPPSFQSHFAPSQFGQPPSALQRLSANPDSLAPSHGLSPAHSPRSPTHVPLSPIVHAL